MKRTVGLMAATSLFLVACGTANNTTSTEVNTASSGDVVSNESNNTTENNTNTSNSSGNDADTEAVDEFDLHIEFIDGSEWEFDYESNDPTDSEIERSGAETVVGEDATLEIETLLTELTINTERPLQEMKDEVLTTLGVNSEDVEGFDLEVKYMSGEEIVFDHETMLQEGSRDILEFTLDIELFSGEEWDYDYDRTDMEAEIERENGDESVTTGQEAIEEIENLLGQIDISMDRSIGEMKSEILAAVGIDEGDVEDFDVDVEFEDGEEIKFKHDVQ
ncbi:hypothetical protein FLK61_39655 [Paenalkalicoccus suaedae]|uniref:YusW-like protein n=1 Tax=Paenalkalicoccus suaedae TaxID=2592382 RepID=A0A859FIZ6_9BACI|nr:YusW family protein [Paenalkalicoccus suaedae]QKS72732.1 hypothetical protein FLK61_39655 [Paenalkalicoccus suaedae]